MNTPHEGGVNVLPRVAQVRGMMQRASPSHVPLVHIRSILKKKLTSNKRPLAKP